MPWHRTRNLLLGLASLLCLGFAGWVGYSLLVHPERFSAAIGGPFTLTDTRGESVSDESFRGRFMLIYFGYTYCPDICPTRLQEMTLALETLETSRPQVAARITPIFITVDPRRDTRQALAAYVGHFHPRLEGLRGSEAEVAALLESYQGYVNYVPSEDGTDYVVDHTAYIYLMDPEGRYATHFTSFDDIEEIVARLSQLAG